MSLSEDVIAIIADYKGLEHAQVTPERTFEELGIDSLDAIDIIYEVEDKFSVSVPQDAAELQDLRTVGDVLTLVERVVAERQG